MGKEEPLMAQSAEIRHDVGFLSTLPLGSIIAWHRDLLEQQVLALPPGWVECNGQTLDDPESPFHGNIIPNLNLVDRDDDLAGHEAGAFLRGAPRSGEFQQDQLQTHTHADTGHQHPRNEEGRPERIIHTDDDAGHGHLPEGGDGNSNPVGALTGVSQARLGEPVNFARFDVVRHGAETRPVNMSVIWIMKVRQFNVAAGGGLFQQRSFASVKFTQEDQDGAIRTVDLGFVPRVLWITGRVSVRFGDTFETGGPITGFADLEDRGKTHAISTIPVMEVSHVSRGSVQLLFSDRLRRTGGVVFRSESQDLEFMTNVPLAQDKGFSIGLQILDSGGVEFPDRLDLQLRLLCMR